MKSSCNEIFQWNSVIQNTGFDFKISTYTLLVGGGGGGDFRKMVSLDLGVFHFPFFVFVVNSFKSNQAVSITYLHPV